uniref:Telomere-associated protein Rif1 N-terminal domain-containing protein n=1 Tax=Strigamia maritima TaxID=126957 RepID=T1JAY1_STRMM
METQVQRIISSKTVSSERLEAYQFLIKFITAGKDIPIFKDFNAVLNVLKQDLKSRDVNLLLESLHLIGIFLRTEIIVNVIEENKLGEIIDDLYKLIMTSEEKVISTRALWCLAKLKVPLILWIEKLDLIMEIIERPQPDDPKQMSGSYELEIIRVLNRLLTEMPEQMISRVTCWSRRLYLATVHPTLKVREPALIVLDTVWSLIQKQQTHNSLVILIADLKDKLVPGMSRMFKEKQEIQSLKLWRILLKLLGKALHQGASLINTLLGIVEKGFKSTNTDVKVEAFKSWHQLIVNFGSELEVLANPKRLRLVMQPLKANNARTEIVASTKFKVWWFLLVVLGPKLVLNLEIVLHPFLQFCFGIEATQSNQSSIMSNSSVNTPDSVQRMNLSNCSSPGVLKFSAIHRLGCEALARILGHKSDLLINRPIFTIDELPYNVLELPQRFLYHSKILLFCVRKAIIGLGTEKKDLHLQLYLLHNAVSHIKINADGDNRKEFSEALSLLLYTFEEFVKEESLSSDVILVKIDGNIYIYTKKVLHSSAYTIEEASVMSGTPSLFLIKLLFRQPLLQQSTTDRFRSIFQKLISEDEDSTVDTLSFTELVVKTLDSASAEIDNSDTLISLWNIVATNLLEKIETTKEINQGDSLEHDFGCIYAVLLFPVNHLYGKPLFHVGLKTLDTTWIKLCKKLGSLKEFVPKVPVNIWCEEFSSKILNNIPDDSFKIIIMQENLSNLFLIIIRLVNFSSADKMFPEGELKGIKNCMKRKTKPLGYVTSFISLYNKLVSAVLESEKELPDKSQATTQIICNALVNLSNIAKILFSKITFLQCLQPLLSHLNESISNLFTIADKIKPFTASHDKFLLNIEEMWDACIPAIQTSYDAINSHEHTELFRIICPVLEASLYYSNTTIREKTLNLWRSTFMLSPARLNLPESFKDVFRFFKTSLVPESSRQVLTALLEILCLSQKDDASKKVKLVPKEQHSAAKDETGASEAKRRRILTTDDKEVTTASPLISAHYSILNPDSYPLVPSPFINVESYLKVESRNSEKNHIAQKAQVTVTSPIKIEDEIAVEVGNKTSSDLDSSVDVTVGSCTSAIHCMVHLPESETSAIVEETPIKEVQKVIESVDKPDPECITNGDNKDVLPASNDDVIQSSKALESCKASQVETKSKSTDEDPLPSPQSTKETLKRKPATKHRARRSMRFTEAQESSSDLDKTSPVKKRRKSSHHVKEECGNDLKTSKTKEKELPTECLRISKTARKSCGGPRPRPRALKSTKTSGKSEIGATIVHCQRQLRRRLNKSDSSTSGERSEMGFSDGVKPMEADGEHFSSPGSKFENLVKSPILNVVQLERESKQSAMDASSSDISILDVDFRSPMDVSIESETPASKPAEPPGEEIQTGAESTLDAITDHERQNASPDLNTFGSELTVGSEVVVLVSSEEKENEMIVTETEVDEIKIDQHASNTASLNNPEPETESFTVLQSKRELRSDAAKTEQSPRRSSKLSSDTVTRTEEGVHFSPQHRYIKTYSKGTPVVKTPKEDSVYPLSAALKQRVGSRGLKFLEAANKRNYEKLKYENKKISLAKSQDRRRAVDYFFKSPSPEMPSTPIASTESMKALLRGNFSSPAGSSSIGILKQLKRHEVPSTGSPSNKRRVSFADPLVQGASEMQNKTEQKDAKEANKPAQSTASLTSNLCPSPNVLLIRFFGKFQVMPAVAPPLTSEIMPVLEKQIPFELEAEMCLEEAIENVVETVVVQPPQLEIAAVTEIESSIEEIGATTEVVTGIETVETLNEIPELKNEQLFTLADEVMAVQMEVESNQREMRMLEVESNQTEMRMLEVESNQTEMRMLEVESNQSEMIEEPNLNTAPEVPEMEMEVSVSIQNQMSVKVDEPAEHVMGESGDAPETLLSKPHVSFDLDLVEIMNNLKSKLTVEELNKSSNSQLLSLQQQLLGFQQQLLNMALTVTNALKLNHKGSGSDE